MQVKIINPEQFVQHNNKIGILMYTNIESPTVNLFTGEQHFVIKRNELESPLMEDLNTELLNNNELRKLALDNNLIEVNTFSMIAYINYCQSYNK